MNKNFSDSDESIEHMKLDLLKAKYVHQKLNKQMHSLNSKSINNINVPKKVNSNPKFSVSRNSQRKEVSRTQLPEENKLDVLSDNSNNSESQDQEDIVKMNDYVDYILNKRRVSSSEDINEESNGTSSASLQHLVRPYQDPQAGNYQKESADLSSAYNLSTDILAQWRLRRKLSEAKISVKSEHQKHNRRINALQSDFNEASFLSQAYVENLKLSKGDDCDVIPVRDVAVTSRAERTVKVLPKVSNSHTSCQCNIVKSEDSISNEKKLTKETLKHKHVRKSKKTVGVMTMAVSNHGRSELNDSCTQTHPTNDDYLLKDSDSKEWQNQSSDLDYIDIAIQKTLQNQLFDRNCNSVLSSVTSINNSQSSQNPPQLDIMEHNYVNIDSNLTNADSLPPWNENYQLESDDDFKDDDVLIDLRKRRAVNLAKLRVLSSQIRNHTGKLTALDLI